MFVNQFSNTVEIYKKDDVQQIIYGKALVPNRVDSQGDIVSKDDVEKTAHEFLMNIQKAYVELLSTGKNVTNASQIGYMHKVFKGVGGFGYIVESYIDQEGSWILATKITNKDVWKKIADGEITGYSIGGKGQRVPVQE